VDEQLIAANPVQRVRPPKRQVDPEAVFGRARRRAYTPEEFGRLLAVALPFYRDHLIVQAGTGLRSGELLGLRGRRVDLGLGRLEVVEVRYDAGRFGSGYKARPKSDTSIRPVPMAGLVVEAVRRRLDGCPPDGLVFCGPGGSHGFRRGDRSPLSVRNYRRAYRLAASRAGLDGLDLHGPHDLRHTFATWLEDAGIPVRVIDELMGHRAARAGGAEARGSAIGAVYRRPRCRRGSWPPWTSAWPWRSRRSRPRCGPSGTTLAQPVRRGRPHSDADLRFCGGGAKGI
jgi:integrase